MTLLYYTSLHKKYFFKHLTTKQKYRHKYILIKISDLSEFKNSFKLTYHKYK